MKQPNKRGSQRVRGLGVRENAVHGLRQRHRRCSTRFTSPSPAAACPYIDKAAKKALKVAEKAYKNKTVSFDKARHRMITWGGPGCYFVDFNTWAYNCWGVLVPAQMDMFSGNVIISEDDLDKALLGIAHNYERGVMRRHLTGGYRHLLEVWDEAEKFNCDMVLVYDDITCKGAMGLCRRSERSGQG